MDLPSSPPAPAGGTVSHGRDRLPLLDALRGLAALGILWRNIFVFGLPTVAFSLPEEWGEATLANVASWLFVVIFVDGTMRGLFSLLFGATALLILDRHARAGLGLAAADLYFRRLMWLVAFGLVHGYLLLWPYDVLYVYGLLGMFLFVFRGLSGSTLLAIALAIFLVSSLKDGTGWSLDEASTEAYDAKAAFLAETGGSGAAEGPDLESLERYALAEIDERLAGYPELLVTVAHETLQEQTTLFFTDHILDVGAMMFFGMALYRLGALTGRWPASRSAVLAAVGLSGGLVLGFLIHGTTTLPGFEAWQIGAADAYLYNLRRLLLCLGLIGLFDLACRGAVGRRLVAPFAAVGRIPLTVYVGQTLVCVALFYGPGFGLFGSFEHHELLAIALAINAAQMVGAVLWARTGRQGPLEALLRFLVDGAGLGARPGSGSGSAPGAGSGAGSGGGR